MVISVRIKSVRDEEENGNWVFVQTREQNFVVNVRLPSLVEYALIVYGRPANGKAGSRLDLLWNFLICVRLQVYLKFHHLTFFKF